MTLPNPEIQGTSGQTSCCFLFPPKQHRNNCHPFALQLKKKAFKSNFQKLRGESQMYPGL